MAATGKEKLYVSSEGGGRSTVSAQEVADLAGGSEGAEWGDIEGALSDQSDLQSALDDKADTSSLADVATSGAYSDLTGAPNLASVATSGDYGDLVDTPTLGNLAGLSIPTSDPEEEGVVWLDGSTLRVSEGEGA